MQTTEYMFIIKTSPLIHFKKTMCVHLKKHAERISTFCGNILFLLVQARGTYSYKCA